VVADIAKLSAGREAYYTRELATDQEQYLSGHGESPRRWYGAGATSLGLAKHRRRASGRCSRAAAPTATRSGPSTPTPMWCAVSSTASKLLAWIIAGAEAHLTRTRSPASPDPPNRLWPVTDAFEHTVHRPGRRGNELWSRTRTERRGNHRPGWEGVALWSFVRSISRAKGRKIIGTSATDRDADP
jgi:hypothetical protein